MIDDIFYKIEKEMYVVIRNGDLINSNFDFQNEDIDILCADKIRIITILGLVPRNGKDTGVHYKYIDKCGSIKIDLWDIDCGYYDKKWCSDILGSRVLNANGVYVPSEVNSYYSLLYHILIHKNELPQKYKTYVINKSAHIHKMIKFSRQEMIESLELFMRQNEYHYTYNAYSLATINMDGVSKDLILKNYSKIIKRTYAHILLRVKVVILRYIR